MALCRLEMGQNDEKEKLENFSTNMSSRFFPNLRQILEGN
jgi:hypothetical protein